VTYYSSAGENAIFFFNSSSAGSANFIVTSSLAFYGPSPQTPTANATILNDPGYTTFSFGGTAGNAMITNAHGGETDIGLDGSAGNATIINEDTVGIVGWQSHTYVGGSGGTATIINKATTVQGGKGGYTLFGSSDSSQSPTIINNGSSFPGSDSAGKTLINGPGASAGIVTVIAHGGTNGGAGGGVVFEDKVANASAARVELDGNGYLDISLRIRPPVIIGSVEGYGKVYLGANNLEIGANNLSTQFSGHIEDGTRNNRTGGSITKIGSGHLTLSGANTYTGGTSVTGGALVVSNKKGSGTGTGDLQVDTGILGGSGMISGVVTIGSGSGAGANLQPGFGTNKATTLTIQSALTFHSDSTYSYQLNTRDGKADQLLAKGVTIESGAQFDLETVANKRLSAGEVFTLISNTSTSPITGTFSNLPDGGVITVGPNQLEASYEGGDGNDLTLTVE
jgi:autotransporter-associated beta strand protein